VRYAGETVDGGFLEGAVDEEAVVVWFPSCQYLVNTYYGRTGWTHGKQMLLKVTIRSIAFG
jgi:hypothetical protein